MRESEGKGEVGEKRGRKRERSEGRRGKIEREVSGRRETKKVREEKGGRGQREKQESMMLAHVLAALVGC